MESGSDPIKDRKPCVSEKEGTYLQKVAEIAEKFAKEEVEFNMAEQKIMDTLAEQTLLHDTSQREIVDLQMRYEQQDEEYQKLRVEGRTKIKKWWTALKTLNDGINRHEERTAEDLLSNRALHQQFETRIDTLEPQLVELTTTIRNNQNARNIELTNLRDQVRAAEEANAVCQSLRNRAERYQQMAMGMSEAKVQSTEQELLAARSKYQQNKLTLDGLMQENREVTSLIAQNDEELKSMDIEHSKKMEELNSVKFNNELNISKYESKIESLNTCILNQTTFTRTILDENAQVQENTCDLEKKHDEAIREMEELNNHIEEMNIKMDLTMKKIGLLDGETGEGNDGMEKEAGTLTVLKERIESLTSEIAHQDEQLACEQRTYDEEKASLQLEIDKCTTENANGKSLDELQGDKAKMAKEIADLERRQQSDEQIRAQERARLTGAIDDTNCSITKLKEEMQRLEFEVEVASSMLEDEKLIADSLAKENDVVSRKLISVRQELVVEEAEAKKWAKATNKLEKAIITYKKQMDVLNNDISVQDAYTSKFNEQHARRKAELVDKIAQLNKKAADNDESVVEMEVKLSNLNDEYNKKKEEYRLYVLSLKQELAALEQTAVTNSNKIANLRDELQESNDRNAKAAAEYDVLSRQIYMLSKELSEEKDKKTPHMEKENVLPALAPSPASSMKQQQPTKPIAKSVHFSVPASSKRHVYDYSSDSSDGGHANPRTMWPRRPTAIHQLPKRHKSTMDPPAATSMQPPGRYKVWRSAQQHHAKKSRSAPDTPMKERPTRDTEKKP